MPTSALPRIALALLCLWPSVLLAEEAPDESDAHNLEIKVVGLSIAKDMKDISERAARMMSIPGGTTVYLAVVADVAEGKQIIRQNSYVKLDRFEDNLGNTMIDKGPDVHRHMFQGGIVRHDEEAPHLAVASINGFLTPDRKATSVRVSGSMNANVASTFAYHDHQAAAIEVGSKLKAGPVTCEIKTIRRWIDQVDGEEWTQVRLAFEGTWPELHEVRFVDEKGRWLKTVHISTHIASSNEAGELNKTLTYNFRSHAKAVTVRFKVWEDLNQVEVPFDFQIGLGLAE